MLAELDEIPARARGLHVCLGGQHGASSQVLVSAASQPRTPVGWTLVSMVAGSIESMRQHAYVVRPRRGPAGRGAGSRPYSFVRAPPQPTSRRVIAVRPPA